MASAARELEPDPLPRDLPQTAPVMKDVERGYVKDETPYEEIDVRADGGRRESGPVAGQGDQQKDKTKGRGLTEGDDGKFCGLSLRTKLD